MAAITWDAVGERRYEGGVDRAVLYTSSGKAVPWNGLISVETTMAHKVEPVFFDGVKINDIVSHEGFSAKIKAYTYPDEFVTLEGFNEDQTGVFLGEQSLRRFHLVYRTKIGNDIDGSDHGYKLHILYNLLVNPSSKNYDSFSDLDAITEFEWEVSGIPEVIEGHRPTSYIVIDSRKIDPWLLIDIESTLYGSSFGDPSLPSLKALTIFIQNWERVIIIDNLDGTWTAIGAVEGHIIMLDETTFEIPHANAIYLDLDTYEISSSEKNEDDLWQQ